MIPSKTRAESRTASRIALWQAAILALITILALGISNVPAQTGKFGFVLQRISADDYDDPEDLILSATGTHLYVADSDNDVIRVVQPFTLETVSAISHRSLDGPKGVDMGDDRLLYVADTGNNRIVSYRVRHDSADPVRTFHKDLDEPTGLTKWRNRLYIVNQSDNSIVVRDAAGKSLTRKKSGSGPGEFDKPTDILVAPEGHIIVSDTDNNRVQILSQALEPLKVLQGKPYDFNEPTHMSLDETGNLFVADSGNHRIIVLDGDFNIVGQIGTGRRGDDSGRLNGPKGVTARNGYVWVSDTGNDRILLYKYVIR